VNGVDAPTGRPRWLTLDGAVVGDVMLRHPKTLPANASLEQARAVLDDDHVHMVLLTDDTGVLVGTVVRTDLPPAGTSGPAQAWSRLAGRVVSADQPVERTFRIPGRRAARRLAVVDRDGTLVGLLCLNRRRTGFCSEADVAARSRARDSAPPVVERRDTGRVPGGVADG